MRTPAPGRAGRVQRSTPACDAASDDYSESEDACGSLCDEQRARRGKGTAGMRIGAHMSVAGGVANAVERAVLHGCEALQIFCKNASQWRGKPLDPVQIRTFRSRIDETGLTPVVS